MNSRTVTLLRDLAQTFVLTIVIFVLVQTFIGQPYQVEMGSMQGTLQPGQFLFVDKLTPRFDAYHRGDIVVFAAPAGAGREEGTPFIKRVIGVPGDTVDIRDGAVWINGAELDEPYVFVDGMGAQPTLAEETDHWIVADGELFLMGDHRTASVDSRFFGPVPIGNVVGRAWLRYWPLDSLSILGGDAPAAAAATAP
jgi:signal peptidase I